jgi:hypothetical protein
MFYIYNLKRIYYRANGHTCYLLLRTYNSAPIAFAFVEPTGGVNSAHHLLFTIS